MPRLHSGSEREKACHCNHFTPLFAMAARMKLKHKKNRICSNKRRGVYLIFFLSPVSSLVPQIQNISICLIVQFHLLHEYIFIAYRVKANLRFGFHNSLVNIKFFGRVSTALHSMSILTVFESSPRCNSGCTLSFYYQFPWLA